MEQRIQDPPSDLPGNRETVVLLVILIALELWIFSGPLGKFFTRDSFFYMTRVARLWTRVQAFLAPSQEMPSISFAALALLRPVVSLDPYYWRWIPILVQIANTLLFYVIGRRILPGKTAALVATGFWGFRSFADGIRFDTNYPSSFLLAFLLLSTIFLAVEGWLRKSPPLKTGSLLAFVLSLMTTKAAIMFPLAIWIAVVLADLRSAEGAVTWERLRLAVKKSIPLMALFACIAILFTGLYSYQLFMDRILAQGTPSVYGANISRDLTPQGQLIGNASGNLAIAFGLMACLLAIWALDILGRRRAWSWIEGAGLVWFACLNLPAFMMGQPPLDMSVSHIPLFGLALAFGIFAQNLSSRIRPRIRFAITVPVVLFGALAFSASMQSGSSVTTSESARQAVLLTSFVSDFRNSHAALPANVTLFFLPAFEKGVSQFLSSDLIGDGKLIEIYYPGTSLKTLHAYRGDPIPDAGAYREHVIVFQYLAGRFFDVTPYFPRTGPMTLYLLPTPEREIAPLLKKEPAGGRKLYDRYVRIACADEGVPLPEDYLARRDLWILQYIDGKFDDVTRYHINDKKSTTMILPTIDDKPPRLRQLEDDPDTAARVSQSHVRILSREDLNRLPSDYAHRDFFLVQYLCGRFTDVTDYYKGRHAAAALRVVRSLDGVQMEVSRAEFYPSYDRFDTLTGAPAFFPTPEREVLTQIGGSTVTIPLPAINRSSQLCFDVSWMYDEGDGGWAEAWIRAGGKDIPVYRNYFKPNPNSRSLAWKEVRFDLPDIGNPGAKLILRCYNDPGKNTAADWLNWRDITIASR